MPTLASPLGNLQVVSQRPRLESRAWSVRVGASARSSRCCSARPRFCARPPPLPPLPPLKPRRASSPASSPPRRDSSIEVSSVAPDGRGAPTFNYTVTASPGGATAGVAGVARSATVTGFTNGIAYRFTVTATNRARVGPPSAVSNAVVRLRSRQPLHRAEADPRGVLDVHHGPSCRPPGRGQSRPGATRCRRLTIRARRCRTRTRACTRRGDRRLDPDRRGGGHPGRLAVQRLLGRLRLPGPSNYTS